MNKIIVICGLSASGKDSVGKIISEKYGFNFVLSHTSRPMRPNESQGNPYIFVTKEQFENMYSHEEFIEFRSYRTLVNGMPSVWYYGVHKDMIAPDKKYLAIVDISGLERFKEYFGDRVISFYLDVDESTRKERCIARGDYDETEWNRRQKDDSAIFTSERINAVVDYILRPTTIDACAEDIMYRLDVRSGKDENSNDR